MNKLSLIALILIGVFMMGCAHQTEKDQSTPINQKTIVEKEMPKSVKQWKYVAVGDSYTSGHGLLPDQSWPAILASHLQKEKINITLKNLAVSGWTSQQAIDMQLPELGKSKPDVATLLIGANDLVQGVPPEVFKERITLLMDQMLATLPGKNLIVLTIPDFSVTPYGSQFMDRTNLTKSIEGFNTIITEEAKKRDLEIIAPLLGLGHSPSDQLITFSSAHAEHTLP